MRTRRLIHFTRGHSLAVFLRWYITEEVREWLDEHAADGEPPHPLFPDNLHFLRHVEWRKRRYPWEWLILKQLRSGELVATGLQLPISITDKRQNISRELWDFLDPDFFRSEAAGKGIKIVQIEVMEAPLPGSVPYVPRADRSVKELVELTENNAVLTIDNQRYFFRGIVHRRIIRRLFDAFVAGSPELTQTLMNEAGVRSPSVAAAFRGYPEWTLLSRHIRTKYAYTWLEPRFY